MILKEVGEPPMPCLPIYLISCMKAGKKEELLYVGKTKTASRFSGGHLAVLKLHDPIYAGLVKKIYRANIWFYFGDEYIALDWVQPEELALKLFDNVESQLIYHFQPTLNSNKKKYKCVQWDFSIHIQNFLEDGFLNDEFVG